MSTTSAIRPHWPSVNVGEGLPVPPEVGEPAERARAEAAATNAREEAARQLAAANVATEKAEQKRLEAEQAAERAGASAQGQADAAASAERKRQADAAAEEEGQRVTRENDRAHRAKIKGAALAALVARSLPEDYSKTAITLTARPSICDPQRLLRDS